MKVSLWFKIVLVLFVASLFGQYAFQVWIEGETQTAFIASVLENWQSEYLQLLVQAMGTVGVLAIMDKRKGLDKDVDLHKKVDKILRHFDD
jgi:hypothetical protein